MPLVVLRKGLGALLDRKAGTEMAELVSLGQPFGPPSRIINVPGPSEKFPGSQQAGQALGLGLARFLGKRKQDKLEAEDQPKLAQALAALEGEDITPEGRAAAIQQLASLKSDRYGGFVDDVLKARAIRAPAAPPSPTQQLTQERLNAFNTAKAIPKKQRTPDQQKTIDDVLRPKGPLVQIGGLPGGFQFLTPAERKTQARAELKKKVAPKALTPTEQKGVQATVDSIVGESKVLPFGAKPGPALKQEDVGKLWESTMEATGYIGRDRLQQRQIENAFDRKIAVLNKGKGIGVLAKQYQWSRSLYNKTHRRPGESIDAFIKRTGL